MQHGAQSQGLLEFLLFHRHSHYCSNVANELDWQTERTPAVDLATIGAALQETAAALEALAGAREFRQPADGSIAAAMRGSELDPPHNRGHHSRR